MAAEDAKKKNSHGIPNKNGPFEDVYVLFKMDGFFSLFQSFEKDQHKS